jgi:ribose transport system ATP-binding protein
MPELNRHLLEARALTKRYPGVLALDQVSLTLRRGEVLAVIGENGAGKSTLMKILAGVEQPDGGEMLLDARPVHFPNVRAALNHGIALIHQELNLSDNLDIAANIFLGREPRRFGLIQHRKLRTASEPLLARVGLSLSPRTLVNTLSIGHQQMVEIAKALSVNARVLIMDEPTSSLSQHETERLFEVIRELKTSGVSLIYISHRLGEVRAVADRVMILRDGKNAGELSREEAVHEKMVRLMVGRDLAQFYQRRPHQPGPAVLEVNELCTAAHPKHCVTFSVRAGEIVGIAGLVGSGRSELLRAIFGIERASRGRLRIGGRALAQHQPADAIRAGIGFVPEDRKQQGVILEMAVRENMTLAAWDQRRRYAAFLDRGYERQLAVKMIGDLKIKTPHPEQPVQFLSGGNQQKVVLAKWLALNPRLLLLDEPTRGIDVGAKQEIYRLIEDLAGSGVAILFVSSELTEIIGLSDRALVMHEGRLRGELPSGALTEEAIMHLATGGE